MVSFIDENLNQIEATVPTKSHSFEQSRSIDMTHLQRLEVLVLFGNPTTKMADGKAIKYSKVMKLQFGLAYFRFWAIFIVLLKGMLLLIIK